LRKYYYFFKVVPISLKTWKLPKNQVPTLVGCSFILLKNGCPEKLPASEEVRIIVMQNLTSTLF
jgi:hypothetical protein